MPSQYFERINFFNGLQTDAKDWQAIEKYHNEKRKLHNLRSHSPGIVHGLKVKAEENGTGYYVEQGVAIDGSGNEIYLPNRSATMSISKEQYGAGGTIYISLEYIEELTKPRDIYNAKEQCESFILEKAKISDSHEAPDNSARLELARIHLAKGWERVDNRIATGHIQHNQIDHDYRLVSGPNSHLTVLKSQETIRAGAEKHYPIEVMFLTHPEEVQHRHYIASAHHATEEKDARVSWKIFSKREKNYIRYILVVKNEATTDGEINYEVRRLF